MPFDHHGLADHLDQALRRSRNNRRIRHLFHQNDKLIAA